MVIGSGDGGDGRASRNLQSVLRLAMICFWPPAAVLLLPSPPPQMISQHLLLLVAVVAACVR